MCLDLIIADIVGKYASGDGIPEDEVVKLVWNDPKVQDAFGENKSEFRPRFQKNLEKLFSRGVLRSTWSYKGSGRPIRLLRIAGEARGYVETIPRRLGYMTLEA